MRDVPYILSNPIMEDDIDKAREVALELFEEHWGIVIDLLEKNHILKDHPVMTPANAYMIKGEALTQQGFVKIIGNCWLCVFVGAILIKGNDNSCQDYCPIDWGCPEDCDCDEPCSCTSVYRDQKTPYKEFLEARTVNQMIEAAQKLLKLPRRGIEDGKT